MTVMRVNDTVRIQVRDSEFDCGSCTNTIEQVLEATAGVERISIDEGAELIEIDYDPDATTPLELEATVEAWGLRTAVRIDSPR